MIVPFKKPIYDLIAEGFAPIAAAIKRGDDLPEWKAQEPVLTADACGWVVGTLVETLTIPADFFCSIRLENSPRMRV